MHQCILDVIHQYFNNGNDSQSDDLNDGETIDISKSKPDRPFHKQRSDISPSEDDKRFVLKLENSDIFNNEYNSSDCDSSDDYSAFPSFGAKLRPKFVEFSNFFPPYPKTHTKGVDHVIELSSELLADEEKLKKFRTALQYSMTKGHRIKTRHNVPFFSIDGEDVPMNYFYRQCNGT